MFRSVFILVLTVVKLSHSFSDVGKWDLPFSGVSNTVYCHQLIIGMISKRIFIYFFHNIRYYG